MFEQTERVAAAGAAPASRARHRLRAVLSSVPPNAGVLSPEQPVLAGPLHEAAPPKPSESSGPPVLSERWLRPVPDAPAPAPGTHPAVGLLQRAVAACAQATDAGQLTGALDTVTLLRLAEAAQGVALRSLAALDRDRGYALEHPELGTHPHASAAAFLHHTVGLGHDDARSRVRLAGRLAPHGDLAPLGALLTAGRTTVAHCRAVAAGVRGLDPQIISDALPAICTLTEHLDPVALARELRERAHAVSDTLAREQERTQRERRGLWLSRSTDGVAHLKGQLPALDADLVEEALHRVMQRQRTALDQTGSRDTRDTAQRRADALVALAQHALASDDVPVPTATGQVGGPLLGNSGVRAAVTVVVTAERLTSQPGAPAARTTSTAQSVLSHPTLLRLTCDADLSRLTLTTAADGSSVVLDLGRQTRTVTPAQWRALVARDRTCVLHGCSRPPAHCQAHHVQHWTRGGPSDLPNYALVCHQHHHDIHTDDTRWHRHHDGRWLTPDGYRPATADPPTLSRLRYPDPTGPLDPHHSTAPF